MKWKAAATGCCGVVGRVGIERGGGAYGGGKSMNLLVCAGGTGGRVAAVWVGRPQHASPPSTSFQSINPSIDPIPRMNARTLDCLIMAKASPPEPVGAGGAVLPAAGAAAGMPLGREDSGTLINCWCCEGVDRGMCKLDGLQGQRATRTPGMQADPQVARSVRLGMMNQIHKRTCSSSSGCACPSIMVPTDYSQQQQEEAVLLPSPLLQLAGGGAVGSRRELLQGRCWGG